MNSKHFGNAIGGERYHVIRVAFLSLKLRLSIEIMAQLNIFIRSSCRKYFVGSILRSRCISRTNLLNCGELTYTVEKSTPPGLAFHLRAAKVTKKNDELENVGPRITDGEGAAIGGELNWNAY